MKAKEYFEKYKDKIIIGEGITELIREFTEEAVKMQEARNANTVDGQVAIIREFNSKWNAIANLFEKTYGKKILKRDAYIEVCKELSPDSADLITLHPIIDNGRTRNGN